MELRDIINKTLKEYSVIFVANRIESMRKAKLESSSDLINSVSAGVQKAGSEDLGTLTLAFNEYGRYFDMKRNNRSKQVPVDEIKEWIQEKGLASFASGYKRKIPVSSANLINAIAWGIVKSKINKQTKRRRWYSKSRGRDINNLYDTLVERYQDYILNNTKDLINGTKKR